MQRWRILQVWVAQVSSLLYRGFLTCVPHDFESRCRLESGDTAGWKPALPYFIRWLCPVCLILTGCRLEMHNQPKETALKSTGFFKNGASARALLPGVIPRGYLRTNVGFFEGLKGTNLVEQIPVKVTRDLLERGRQRFDIYCSVCHGPDGEANGMIVQRGFPQPPSLHIDRLRQAPDGHFFRVITYGYGVMFPYAVRVAPEDRWAIVAYIRALQLSHAGTLAQLPAGARARLEAER
jgi:mono/diheme cytochrome c family protein